MSKINKTPGVYIEEKDAFGRSIVPVSTAVPYFVGFTEKAERNNASALKTLIKVKSLSEFINFFGGYPLTKFDVSINSQNIITVNSTDRHFYLFNALKLYFANGGGDCYIYSIGNYDTNIADLSTADFTSVLKPLEQEPEPTLIVMPDAHLLKKAEDYYSIWQAVLSHCKKMINRFAILDIHNGGDIKHISNPEAAKSLIDKFRDGIGTTDLAYGAVYWPWVQATVVQPRDLSILNFQKFDTIKHLLCKNIDELYPSPGNDASGLPLPNPKGKPIKDFIKNINAKGDKNEAISNHNALLQLSPLYKAVLNKIRDTANRMPASAAMAGIYKYVDNERGTFQAPANVSVSAVAKPLLTISDHDQEDLNIPIDGKAINAIRTFPGKGTLVWGARTMDGNSKDWRYISVRRTVSMIELSIKYAAEAYIFEPNNASTWANIQSMISNFLTNMWQAGALAGTTAAEAFSVSIGLGSTMTPVDILDGYMNIMVKVAVARPAEYIVLTFQQQMQVS